MKRTLLFLACVLTSIMMLAQDVNHTFLEEGKVWTYHYQGMNGRSFDIDRVVDGDTIIGDQSYKKICDKMGGKYQYALREEGKQVYIVYDHQETPSLLYDFGKNKGDVIYQEVDELSGMVSEQRVIGVDTIDIDGLRLRRLQIWGKDYSIQNPVNWEEEEVPWQMASYWIEGVGSECLLEASFRQTGNYYTLKSCQINGRTYTQQELLQEPSKPNDDYLPFVDKGKRWIVTRATPGRDGIDEVEYSIPLDVEEVDGKDYYRMKTVNTNNTETETYLIREESQKVYYYDPDLKMEFLAFDYSLKEGDTYETYSYETHEMVTYTVWSVEDYTGGPQVKEYYYDENTGNMAVRYRYLRKWVASSYIESVYCYEPKVWIEGVGSLERPLTNLYQGSFTLDCLAYVLYNGQYDLYLPFSFNATDNKVLWYGRNMPISAKDDNSEDEQHQLTYEMEGDRLHVYGEVFCNCGPNHYAYFIEEPTDDHSVRKLHFKIQDVEPLVWCEALHTTDFYVEGLPPAFDYIIVDNQGEEHPVINKAPLNVYRPFIQDDKVWAVKVITDGLPTEEWMEYFYFDGDTIVGGQVAKRMLCDRISSSQDTTGEYVGAWYEQDQKVYFAGDGKQQFELLYDFTLKSHDTMPNLGGSISVVYKWTGIYTGFKGTLYSFGQECWYEGVGSNSWPYVNHPWYLDSGRKGILLVCKAGDEIIYYNSEEEDPFSMGAKKHRFDFTHTIKTKPRTRSEAEEQSLYGEYNNQLLDINLNPLDDTYLVRITNESDQVVYEKTINAGSIVGLNIDISAFAKGRYTVTMENSSEVFTGEFDTKTTGIQELKSSRIEELKSIYNLQGQRLNTLQKGLNIVNGRKVFVK